MKVLLISANRTEINMRTIPLGLACVAHATMRAGHETRMLDLVQVGDIRAVIADAIEEFKPDVTGISIRNIDDQVMRGTRFLYEDDRSVIAIVRELTDCPIILGGSGYSMFPAAILDNTEADIGIEGEGELAFIQVLDSLRSGNSPEGLPGVHVKGGGPASDRVLIRQPDDLSLPEPAHMLSGTVMGADLWMPVQTRRGCPMDCSYCSTASIEGRTIRKRPVRAIVEWIDKLTRLGVRQLYFVDNTFNLPPSYAMALCKAISGASLDVTWRCILYPYRIEEPLVSAMAEAGCFEVSIGSESGCDEILKGFKKRFRSRDVEQSCALLKSYGIRQMGFLMLGAPGETKETVEESLVFADSLGLDMLKVSIGIRIYPGTSLAVKARVDGIISYDDNLLRPRFYITPGLDEGWVRERVEHFASTRPHWITG